MFQMSMGTLSPKQANNNKWLHLLVFVSHNTEQNIIVLRFIVVIVV